MASFSSGGPIGGGLAVFRVRPRSKVEVVNDLDGDLVNFYRVIKHHEREFLRAIRWEINTREVCALYGQRPGETDIGRAVRWWMRPCLSFGGLGV